MARYGAGPPRWGCCAALSSDGDAHAGKLLTVYQRLYPCTNTRYLSFSNSQAIHSANARSACV